MEPLADKAGQTSGPDLLSKTKLPTGGFRHGPEIAELKRSAKAKTPHLKPEKEAETNVPDPTLTHGSYNNGYFTYTGMMWRNFLPHGEGKKSLP